MFYRRDDVVGTAAALVAGVGPPEGTRDDPAAALAAARDRVASLDADGVLDVAEAAAYLGAFAEALSLLATAALGELCEAELRDAGRPPGVASELGRSNAAAELAVVTPMTPRTAEARLDYATQVAQCLSRTWAALAAGDLDAARVRRVADGTLGLTPEQARDVEDLVLGRAPTQTTTQLARAVTRARLTVEPDPQHAAERARRRCDVSVHAHADDPGLADLVITGPAPLVAAAFGRVDALARERTADASDGDGLGRGPARAEVALAVLAGDDESAASLAEVDVELVVVAPATTVLGAGDEPGELTGPVPLGPLPADMVRELAADARWRRWFTDADGMVTGVGRRSYRPPAALADLVRARDRTCRFPRCSRRAERCDLDHTRRYPDGPTEVDNLSALCRRHHRLKHEAGWAVTQQPGTGDLEWTTPHGRTVTTAAPRHDVAHAHGSAPSRPSEPDAATRAIA